MTEMVNTAIESAIDLTVSTYNPQAKIAKDVVRALLASASSPR